MLVEKPEQKRPLEGLEDNIKTDLREMGYHDVKWIQQAAGRVKWRVFFELDDESSIKLIYLWAQ
jgi:hypothetical protein